MPSLLTLLLSCPQISGTFRKEISAGKKKKKEYDNPVTQPQVYVIRTSYCRIQSLPGIEPDSKKPLESHWKATGKPLESYWKKLIN
jgi:hypothetical protein